MVKTYFCLLKNIVHSIGITKGNYTNGVYNIRTVKGGRLHKIIGIEHALQVKELTVTGKINVMDLYFILHMDNLEVLNLRNAIYPKRQRKDEMEKSRLRREMLRNKKHLKEIWFPNSLKSVPCELFKDCIALEHVILPKSVKTICSHAFSNSGIKELVIPASVEAVEASAFDNCRNLKQIKVEDSEKLLKWKGEQFRYCPNLQEIYLGRNSAIEYALITDAPVNRLVLGENIHNMNFDIINTKNLICLMKHPPRLPNYISAENVYVKQNFEHYWLHPEWNKRKLIKMNHKA